MKLKDCTKLIRSKNAGPFVLTIDVMFESPNLFAKCLEQELLSAANIAKIYGIELRVVSQGDLGDADNHGGQQYAPLLDLEIVDGS